MRSRKQWESNNNKVKTLLSEDIINKYRIDAEGLAKYFSDLYFSNHKREFPINSFQILTDFGIHFVFRNFVKNEGLYLPTSKESKIIFLF